MRKKLKNSNCLDVKNNSQIKGQSRFVVPGDFIFKIQSFSSVLDWTTRKVQSGLFESGGYKWRLSLSLSGSNKQVGGDNISLYLSLADTTKLPSGWEVLINCKFFMFNHIKNEYLSVQGDDKKLWRFHCLKTEWLHDQPLPMSTFVDPTNGFLVDDCCAFGVEICVIKPKPNNATLELLDLSKTIVGSIFTWKIEHFSYSKATILSSPQFVIGGRKWELELFPKGHKTEADKSLSCYLSLVDFESLGESQLEVKFKLRIIDQVSGAKKECEVLSVGSESKVFILKQLLGLSMLHVLEDLNDASNKYLVDNTLLMEVEILKLSMITAIKIPDVPKDPAIR